MARLKLADGVTQKQLGQAILALASMQDFLRRSISDEEGYENIDCNLLAAFIKQAETQVNELYFDKQELRERLDLEQNPVFAYQFDGATISGEYLLNIVVPDIGQKKVEFKEVFESLKINPPDNFSSLFSQNAERDLSYDFRGFAEESMGFVVIFGCGR